MDINKFLVSKTFRNIALAMGLLALIFLVFRLGEAIGFRKAEFSYRFGERVYRDFSGPRPMMPFGMERPLGGLDGDEFLAGNGTVGRVLSVNSTSSSFVVGGQGGSEKVVLVTTSTAVRAPFGNTALSGLKVNDRVAVIGMPNSQGQIVARLIRIFTF